MDARFCEYCGSALPSAQPAPRPAEPTADLATRFRALRVHPELEQLLEATPEAPELVQETAVGLIALLVFGLIGLFVAVGFFTICPPLGVIPLALILFGAIAMTRRFAKTRAALRAPLETRPALVVEARMKLEGEGEYTSARTRHLATLLFEDGERRELDVLERVAGRLSSNLLGVAYLRGDTLIAFEPLSV